MRDFIEFVTKKIVERRDDVHVREIESDEGVRFEVHVHPEDIGRLIGRNGRTIKALRVLVNTAAVKQGVNATLEVVEQGNAGTSTTAEGADAAHTEEHTA